MKKLFFSLLALTMAVTFTACNSEKEEIAPVITYDVTKILGSWTVTSYSYIITNTDVDTLITKDVRQNPGEITITDEGGQYLYTETFTSPLALEQGGDVLLHETTFDLRGSVPDYPELWGLTDKVEGETITWSGSLTGEATITRQHSGQAEETVTYHYRIDTKITVKKK